MKITLWLIAALILSMNSTEFSYTFYVFISAVCIILYGGLLKIFNLINKELE